jgi:hypothetical protein
MVNSQPLDFIGQTAKKIMNSVGPLYYQEEWEGGLYYQADGGDNVSYIFPWDTSLDAPEPADTAGTTDVTGDPAGVTEPVATPDPNKYPLKASATCVAVAMTIGDYVPKVSGDISAENLMSAISIKNYKIEKNEADGAYHLYYSKDGLTYNYTLKNKSTASANGLLMVMEK